MTREQYLTKRNSLMAIAKSHMESGDLDAFAKAKKDVEDLDAKYEAEAAAQANFAALQNSAVVPAQLQNLGGAASGIGTEPPEPEDRFDSREYKQAFMNFVCRREPIPTQFRSNAAASTAASDVGAVIPTTTLKEIIRNLKERGIIFQSMRRLNVQGGVEIPILDLYPTATWVGENPSEDQKLSAKNTISFKYYGLECKLAQSILVSVVTFDEFPVPLPVSSEQRLALLFLPVCLPMISTQCPSSPAFQRRISRSGNMPPTVLMYPLMTS